jgi:hypothetical protein
VSIDDFVYHRPWTYPKQEAAIFHPIDRDGNIARYGLIEASTKTGKTFACLLWLFEQAYQGPPHANYWWIAPVYSQAVLAFTRMRNMIPPELVLKIYENSRIVLVNDRTIWFKSGEKPDGLYGEDVYAAVMDEASRMRQEAFHAVRTTLTATRGPIRIIGNVKGRKNWFYNLCRRAQKGAPNLGYSKLIAHDAVEAGILTEAEVEDAKRQLPESVFKELYLAEAADDGGNPFGLASIQMCVSELSDKKPRVWGWDLAKRQDWTVGIALDDDGRVCRFERFQLPWPATLSKIVHATGRTPALVDSTGIGDPILELNLQKVPNTHFEGYQFTQQSKQKLMEGLAVKIQKGEVHYPDGIIVLELESFEYEYTRTGVLYGVQKGENNHDDTVCSLALAVEHFGRVKRPMIITDRHLQLASMPGY